MKTTYDKSQFIEQGYTIIHNALPKEDLANFKAAFLRILMRILKEASKKHPHLQDIRIDNEGDEALLALRYTDPNYVAMVQRLISRTPEFFRLSSTPQLFHAVRDCMQLDTESPLYLLSNGIVFTNPSDKANKRSTNFDLPWHKDTFFTIPENFFVQFWGPVIHPSTEEIGTLVVCPGSHKDGYGKQCVDTEVSFSHRYTMAPGEEKKYSPVPVELELGELLIFHGDLMHGSGINNTTNKIRTTILGICHDASRQACVPVSTHYKYHGRTPEQWYYELYKDDKVKPIIDEQLAEEGEPIGGI